MRYDQGSISEELYKGNNLKVIKYLVEIVVGHYSVSYTYMY